MQVPVSSLTLLGMLMACGLSTQSLARREIGNIPVGATAYVVCHGHLLAREDQEYISLNPIPIVVDVGIDPASLETFNGTSDTPEPLASAEFERQLEASFGGAASAQCHLSKSAAAARAMLEFWQGQYGPPGYAAPRLVTWTGPSPDTRQARNQGRRKSAATNVRSKRIDPR